MLQRNRIPLNSFRPADHLPRFGVEDLSLKPRDTYRPPDPSKIFRKYHGKKKILSRKNQFLISKTHSSILHHVSVKNCYLFSVSLAKSPQVHVRELDIVIGSLIKNHSRPLLPKMLLSNQLSHCKRVNSIKISKFGYYELVPGIFSKMRTLNNLRTVSLSLTEQGLYRMCKYFIRLQSLQKLDLVICKKCSEETETISDSIVTDLYAKLFDCKILSFLGLNLEESDHLKKPSHVAIFLNKLAESRIPFFRIHFKTEYPSKGIIEGLQPTLSRVNLLTLINTDLKPFSWDLIDSNPDPQPIKTNRMLSISLTDVPKPVYPLNLTSCELSNNAYVNASEVVRMMTLPFYMMSIPISNTGSCEITKLRSLSLSCNCIRMDQYEQIMKNLIQILTISTSLEQLTLFSIKLGNCALVDEARNLEKQILLTRISNLKQLKYLKIYANIDEDGITMLSEILFPLENLEKFVFSASAIITKQSSKKSKFFIEFPKSSKLSELTINIPEISPESLINLFETVSKLEELRKLSIEVINLNGIFEKDPHQFMKVIDILHRMDKLREVKIKNISTARGIGCMVGLRIKNLISSKDVETKKKTKEEIRKYALKMFDKNRNLDVFVCNIFDFVVHLVK